jgi:hypothetical protein
VTGAISARTGGRTRGSDWARGSAAAGWPQRRAGRGRCWRRGVLAAGVTALVLLTAACGGGGGSAGPAESAGQPGFQKSLAYAACMRSHGAPGYPDPNSQGQFIRTLMGMSPGRAAATAAAALAAIGSGDLACWRRPVRRWPCSLGAAAAVMAPARRSRPRPSAQRACRSLLPGGGP